VVATVELADVVEPLSDYNLENTVSSLPHLAHDRLLTAMRVVESLPPSACGALLVGSEEEPLGTILIEANRVCWGAASGMSGRLRDILRSHCHASVGDDELDAIYAHCRRECQPLSEILFIHGLVTPASMRAALKQHTIESLLAVDAAVVDMCGRHTLEWPMHWIDHTGCGYRPRFTFGAVEVLEAAGAQRLDETEAAIMAQHLEELAGPHNALVAFSFQPDGTPLYVGASTQLPIDLQDLIELTTWAEAALGASQGFSAEVAHACTQIANGGAMAWRYEGQHCAALCVDGDSLRRLGVMLGNRSLAVVLATRTQVLDRVRARIGKS
jgi:hypothetical protein